MKIFREQLGHTYKADGRFGPVKASGGETGNGGETLVIGGGNGQDLRINKGNILYARNRGSGGGIIEF